MGARINQSVRTGGKRLIFLVDDQPMLLEFAAAVLAPLGHEVRTFSDPAEALRSYAEADPRPGVLITDYAMDAPLNGLELISECRRIEPRQKSILFSGTVDQKILTHSTVKPDFFLTKPFAPAKFLEVVQSLLAG